MAKDSEPKININLSSRGKRTVGKVFYAWAINAGRAIIVLIELIALIALGYRFVIDRQIVDLHEEIKHEASLIELQAKDEQLFRSIQQRLAHISQTQDDTTLKFSVMNEVIQTVTEGTLFQTKFTINEKTATIDGTTLSVLTLTNFIEELKRTDSVAEISVSEINTTDSGVNFRIILTIEQPRKV